MYTKKINVLNQFAPDRNIPTGSLCPPPLNPPLPGHRGFWILYVQSSASSGMRDTMGCWEAGGQNVLHYFTGRFENFVPFPVSLYISKSSSLILINKLILSYAKQWEPIIFPIRGSLLELSKNSTTIQFEQIYFIKFREFYKILIILRPEWRTCEDSV